MKVLLTGIDGFVASHFAEFLSEYEHVDIYGTIRRLASRKNISNVEDNINIREMELTDSYSVENVINDVKPDRIYHLAAQSFVPESWTSPTSTMNVNINGTINILEACRKLNYKPFIQLSGSSEEYGAVDIGETIFEDTPLNPLSPYGVSKVATDLIGYQYAKSYGMNIVRTRAFNMSGPRRGEMFFDSNFAKQIVNIERGKFPPVLYVGNLDAFRDITHVKDVVRAMWELGNKATFDPKVRGNVYNITSEHCWQVKSVLDYLLDKAGVPIKVIKDPSRLRPSDVPYLHGSSKKLKYDIEWEPEYTVEKTLDELLDYWRNEING